MIHLPIVRCPKRSLKFEGTSVPNRLTDAAPGARPSWHAARPTWYSEWPGGGASLTDPGQGGRTMSSVSNPMPPRELRRIVGPTEPEAFDNPRGEPLFAPAGLPPDAYDVVFDFGCGCGRLARQLLQQKPRPRRYVGVDAHRGMVEWCQQNLSPVDPAFQ